jgi:hypothetical protein
MKAAIFENLGLENLKGGKNLGLIFTNQWHLEVMLLFRNNVLLFL